MIAIRTRVLTNVLLKRGKKNIGNIEPIISAAEETSTAVRIHVALVGRGVAQGLMPGLLQIQIIKSHLKLIRSVLNIC